MSAEEMFEELDYNKSLIDDEVVYNWNATDTSSYYRYISFDLENKKIELDDSSTEPFYLTFEELQAINKQLEELG